MSYVDFHLIGSSLLMQAIFYSTGYIIIVIKCANRQNVNYANIGFDDEKSCGLVS